MQSNIIIINKRITEFMFIIVLYHFQVLKKNDSVFKYKNCNLIKELGQCIEILYQC